MCEAPRRAGNAARRLSEFFASSSLSDNGAFSTSAKALSRSVVVASSSDDSSVLMALSTSCCVS